MFFLVTRELIENKKRKKKKEGTATENS